MSTGNFDDSIRAFPVATIDGYTQYGMTLRDYFAAKAMAAIISNPANGANFIYPHVADVAYRMADAILKEREK